jgi:hypothetical protein
MNSEIDAMDAELKKDFKVEIDVELPTNEAEWKALCDKYDAAIAVIRGVEIPIVLIIMDMQ